MALLWCSSTIAADLPGDWRYEQQFSVDAPGLVKFSLPMETLDKARPALEDLRLYDEAGGELPYLIEPPRPATKTPQTAKSFQVSLNPANTVITLETGLAQPVDGVSLVTPSTSFIKSVQVEGSADGKRWEMLAQGQAIFRQPGGASQLWIPVRAALWPWLRLTVDDRRSQPIPFSGAQIHAAGVEPVLTEPLALNIAERHESPGETRLTLKLGAANLDLATLQIETPEPLFTRQVTVAVPEISEDSIREQPLASGSIYRIAVDGQPASANLNMALENQVRSREMLLLIKNQDSPPLPVTAVRAERRPVYLVFLARQAGVHHLLTGNSRCAAPRYDLASMAANLKTALVLPIKPSPALDNSSYRLPEVLPGIQADGAALNVVDWSFRKAVKLTGSGAQQIELDLDVLSHAQPGFQDLRLLRDGKQLPYILERTSISRSLAPAISMVKDAKDPKLSRWSIKLSQPALPVSRLSCRARTPLFQRSMVLWEEISDDRGEKSRRTLGEATWVQTPERSSKEFTLIFERPPEIDTLILETHNGDNPPIELENLQLVYPVTRLLFKAKLQDEISLYYGNPRVSQPRYDLSLVASELLASDKTPATLAAEEPLKKSWRGASQTSGKGGVLLWVSLALVIVVLLAIISRLLPKSSEASK